MLVLLACVLCREAFEQTHKKKRKTSSALYAAPVRCRVFEQNSPQRHKATRGGTFSIAGGHCKTSQALFAFWCVPNSPGERHLATSSHALNKAKLEQRVPKLPVRLQMSESNRLDAGTWLGGRAGHNCTRNLR